MSRIAQRSYIIRIYVSDIPDLKLRITCLSMNFDVNYCGRQNHDVHTCCMLLCDGQQEFRRLLLAGLITGNFMVSLLFFGKVVAIRKLVINQLNLAHPAYCLS